MTDAQKAATAQALDFIKQRPPDDPATAIKLVAALDAAGLDCTTKERCVVLTPDITDDQLINLGRMYMHVINYPDRYPLLYLRYYATDEVVLRLAWVALHLYGGDAYGINPNKKVLGGVDLAHTPGFKLKTFESQTPIGGDPLSWVLRFHPADPTGPYDPAIPPNSMITPLAIPSIKSLPGIRNPVISLIHFLTRDTFNTDARPDRGIWRYLRLAKGFDYATLLSEVEKEDRLRGDIKNVLRNWVVAQAKENNDVIKQ